MTEINRLKAIIELRKIDAEVQLQIKAGKIDWPNEEIQLIESKKKTLNEIITLGKGNYNFDLLQLQE